MGGASKTCIIAEVGVNFNGDFENCKKMIAMAANAGCDGVKFQLFSAENLYPRSAGKLDWKDGEREYAYDIFEAAQCLGRIFAYKSILILERFDQRCYSTRIVELPQCYCRSHALLMISTAQYRAQRCHSRTPNFTAFLPLIFSNPVQH